MGADSGVLECGLAVAPCITRLRIPSAAMTTARDEALDLLTGFSPRHARVREALAERLPRLSDTRERGLLTEIAYGTVRRLGTLDAILRRFVKRPLARLDPVVHAALRMGLYQMLFLDRVPVHAVVDQAVRGVRQRGSRASGGFVNGVLRSIDRALEGPAVGEPQPRRDVPREDGSALRFEQAVFADPEKDFGSHLGQRYGMPPWLVRRWRSFYGPERTEDILRAAIVRPGLTARARGNRDALVRRLVEDEGIAATHGSTPTALVLPGAEGQAQRFIDEGALWIQDATSQRVVGEMDIQPGQRVLDLCAAPGGKTLHIADRLVQGTLVACDVAQDKLDRLRALPIDTNRIDFSVREVPREGELPFAGERFDRILIDAPCSNTGVLRRRVEARWRLEPRDIEALAKIQFDLLARALPLLAEGGVLTFSTCSIEPEEGEGVAQAFAAAHPGLVARPGFRAFPTSHADGGYCIHLRRMDAR